MSAIGDVAMTVPVIYSLKKTYPDAEITFVSQKFARGFIGQIPGITLFEVDLKGRHKGLKGIFKIYFDLRKLGPFDIVADLHNVIRSKIIRTLFRLSSSKIVTIDKGRTEKRNLCKINGKQLVQLETTVARYSRVFHDAGFTFETKFESLFTDISLPKNITDITGEKQAKWIGIAPFAKHKGKIYPIELMEKSLAKFASGEKTKIFLLGGGANEKAILSDWEKRYPNTISLAGKLSIEDELRVIANFDVLISMDSANMHFASLVNTPVVSVWGATHPYAGFYGWNQHPENAIQVDLVCRPCSIYGNKPCFRKDYACLYQITPEMIVDRTFKVAGIS